MCVSKVCKVNFEHNLEQDARKQVPHSYLAHALKGVKWATSQDWQLGI